MSDEFVGELATRIDQDSAFAAAFLALTPGRRREYNYHISGAKQAATRERRLEKCVPRILVGHGLRDRTDTNSERPPLQANDDGVVLLSGGNPQIAKGDGPAPVGAYVRAMPGWKHRIGAELDALIEEIVPSVERAVRWNSPWYGVAGLGWFMSLHCFDQYIKVTFLKGALLVPPPMLVSKDPEARYVHLQEKDKVDTVEMRSWIAAAAAIDGWHGF